MDNVEEKVAAARKRIHDFSNDLKDKKAIPTTVEIQYMVDKAYLDGYADGKIELAEKLDGILTNMNNKMED